MSDLGDAMARAQDEYRLAAMRLHWHLSDGITPEERETLPASVRERLAIADAAWEAKEDAAEAYRAWRVAPAGAVPCPAHRDDERTPL